MKTAGIYPAMKVLIKKCRLVMNYDLKKMKSMLHISLILILRIMSSLVYTAAVGC